jgi:hypothetical protein
MDRALPFPTREINLYRPHKGYSFRKLQGDMAPSCINKIMRAFIASIAERAPALLRARCSDCSNTPTAVEPALPPPPAHNHH